MKKIPLHIYLSQSIVALSEVVMIYSLKFAIDSMVKKDLRTLIFVVLLIFGIVCIVQSYRVFNIYLIEKFIYQKNITIRNIFVKNIFCLKPQGFFKFSVGDYISLFTNKIERLETDVLRTKIRQSYDISAFLYTIVAVTWLSW